MRSGASTQSGAGCAEELGVDLASPASVRDFAKEVAARGIAPRALVCNAGLQVSQGPRLTADGYELTFAANHLGHFLLVNLLLERLAPAARIVIVSSGVHDPAQFTGMPKAAVGDLAVLAATGGPDPNAFDGRLAYVNSKLCNLWFAYELDRRLLVWTSARGAARFTVNAWEPGLVPGSGLAREYPARRARLELGPPRDAPLHPLIGISTSGFWPRAARMVLDPGLAAVSGNTFPTPHAGAKRLRPRDSYDVSAQRALEARARMRCLLRRSRALESHSVQGARVYFQDTKAGRCPRQRLVAARWAEGRSDLHHRPSNCSCLPSFDHARRAALRRAPPLGHFTTRVWRNSCRWAAHASAPGMVCSTRAERFPSRRIVSFRRLALDDHAAVVHRVVERERASTSDDVRHIRKSRARNEQGVPHAIRARACR